MNQAFSSSIFGSRSGFETAFACGLDGLLDSSDLNLFILVLANASFDHGLFQRMQPRLLRQYRKLYSELRDRLPLDALNGPVDEDLQVFAQIAAVGLEQLTVTRRRSAGPWEIQFNQLRSFRPLRNSQRAITSIREPFVESEFHFNKPFIQQETIWAGQLLGQQVDLYYNKYPFVDSHALLVPERQSCLPQFLDKEMHAYIWQLVRVLGVTVPGFRLGYNAFGACASVNHLHLQLFVRDPILPVEAPHWRHNGGAVDYPTGCRVFDDPESAWSAIERLHQRNRAYNLLFTADRLYCLPRRSQGGFELAEWSSGFAWYEMCGGMLTFDGDAYPALTEATIEASLARARLDDDYI